MKPSAIILTLILSGLLTTLIAQESNSAYISPEENILVLTRKFDGKKWVFTRGSEVVIFPSNQRKVQGVISSIDLDGITVNQKTIPLAHIKKIKPRDSFLLATMKPVSGVATLLVASVTVAAVQDDFFDGYELQAAGIGVGLALVASVPLLLNNPKEIGRIFSLEILPAKELRQNAIVK